MKSRSRFFDYERTSHKWNAKTEDWNDTYVRKGISAWGYCLIILILLLTMATSMIWADVAQGLRWGRTIGYQYDRVLNASNPVDALRELQEYRHLILTNITRRYTTLLVKSPATETKMQIDKLDSLVDSLTLLAGNQSTLSISKDLEYLKGDAFLDTLRHINDDFKITFEYQVDRFWWWHSFLLGFPVFIFLLPVFITVVSED